MTCPRCRAPSADVRHTAGAELVLEAVPVAQAGQVGQQ